MNTAYLIHLANYSDGVLYVLAGLLLVALGVMVDRFWYLRRTILRGTVFVQELAQHGRLDRDALQTLAEDAGELPEAALLKTAASHSGHVQGEALAWKRASWFWRRNWIVGCGCWTPSSPWLRCWDSSAPSSVCFTPSPYWPHQGTRRRR